MKKLILYQLVRYIATYHFLSFFVVFVLLEVHEASGRPDVKTKLLLQNIRTHLAQKADEMAKEQECESGLILCKNLKSRAEEGEEEKSEEIRPPPKLVRGQHKPLIKVKPKDVIQTFMPKGHKSLHRKFQKTGEKERFHKFIHSPEPEESSEADDESEWKTPDKDATSVKKTKKVQDLLKESVQIEEKQRGNIHVKSPKIEKKNLKDEPTFENLKKIINKKVQLEEKNTVTRIRKALVREDKKDDKKKKDIKKGEMKGEERHPREETFIFPNFVFVLDSENTKRNDCGKYTQIYLKQLKKYEMWALMMYDASAKLPSGVLQGNTNQYGDFDECLSVNAVFKKSRNKPKGSSGIKGKYCLANIDMSTDSESKGLRSIQERGKSFSFVKSTIHDPGHFIPRFSTINWGLCVPSVCLAEDVEKFLKHRFEAFTNTSGLKFEVKVDEDNCVVKDDLKFKLQPETVMTILFYLVVLTISLYATYVDVKTKTPSEDDTYEVQESGKDKRSNEIAAEVSQSFSLKEKIKRLIMAFSLKKNVEKFLSDSKGNIECINGIKSIFTVLLYLAHKTIPLAMTPFSNRVVLTKISNQPMTTLLRASIVYTDSFLLISGMLTAYGLAKDISEKKKMSWIKKSIARFIRLTPPLMAVILFYAYVWDQLGSGPIWNLVVKRNSLLCRQYLWRNSLYIQNLFDFEDMCAPQTHQLALDMQLSLLAPLFVNLLHTYDKVGIGILQALFVLSSILRYTTTSKHNLSVVIYHGMPVTQLYRTANLLYAQAIHRASPYILGTVVGYYLNKFENKVNIPKALAALGWITAFAFGYYSLASPSLLASRTYQYDVQEAAQYAALSPVTWSLALCWVISACHLGLGGKLNEFLCQRIFLLFSRISYSVYLTQFLVFFYKIGVQKVPEMFTFAGSINVAEFVLVILVSTIVTLFFDIPTMEIKKIILDEKTAKTPPEESSDLSESLQKKDESGSVSGEESQEITDELMEGTEDEVGEEEGTEEIQEGSDENPDEETDDDNETAEVVFEIRPLRRSSRMHFSDESDDKECFKIKLETGDDDSK